MRVQKPLRHGYYIQKQFFNSFAWPKAFPYQKHPFCRSTRARTLMRRIYCYKLAHILDRYKIRNRLKFYFPFFFTSTYTFCIIDKISTLLIFLPQSMNVFLAATTWAKETGGCTSGYEFKLIYRILHVSTYYYVWNLRQKLN